MMLKMLDLFCGLGGASQAMRERGWLVHTLDIDPKFHPTWCMDINDFHASEYYDLIWCSPVCTEFSKMSMPWFDHSIPPSMRQVEECYRIIEEVRPRWWVIENVRGAVPYLGTPTKRVGSRYLWGDFPVFDCKHIYGKWRLPPSEDRASLRSMIPRELSYALCLACESYK